MTKRWDVVAGILCAPPLCLYRISKRNLRVYFLHAAAARRCWFRPLSVGRLFCWCPSCTRTDGSIQAVCIEPMPPSSALVFCFLRPPPHGSRYLSLTSRMTTATGDLLSYSHHSFVCSRGPPCLKVRAPSRLQSCAAGTPRWSFLSRAYLPPLRCMFLNDVSRVCRAFVH